MKSAIYIRTSTDGQTPELQLRDIYRQFPESKDCIVYSEQKSAFKDNVKRPEFNNVLAMIDSGEIEHLYVWAWDRLYRDYNKLKDFFYRCKRKESKIATKVHSVQEVQFEQFINLPEPFDTMLTELMQTLFGYMAQQESQKKSERIKMAVDKTTETTMSLPLIKNNFTPRKWGHPKEITPQQIELIKQMKSNNISLRKIASEVGLSKSAVHLV